MWLAKRPMALDCIGILRGIVLGFVLEFELMCVCVCVCVGGGG